MDFHELHGFQKINGNDYFHDKGHELHEFHDIHAIHENHELLENHETYEFHKIQDFHENLENKTKNLNNRPQIHKII